MTHDTTQGEAEAEAEAKAINYPGPDRARKDTYRARSAKPRPKQTNKTDEQTKGSS